MRKKNHSSREVGFPTVNANLLFGRVDGRSFRENSASPTSTWPNIANSPLEAHLCCRNAKPADQHIYLIRYADKIELMLKYIPPA